MIELMTVIKKMGNGSTIPYLVQCSDGKKYVAKFPGNPEGKRVLINEYICGSIARKLKLPCPLFELIKVKNISRHIGDDSEIELIDGTAFGSEYLDKVSIADDYEVISKTDNKNDAIKILIFDIIINNNDRNPGNLLVNFKNKSLVMIDHSHVFENEAIWDSNSLMATQNSKINVSKMNQKNYNNLIQCLNCNDYGQEIREFVKLVKKLTKKYFEELTSTIPNDWNISNEDKNALVEYLTTKFSRVDEICRFININLKGGE